MAVPMEALVEAVKAHAVAHYEQGWDVVVEAFEDVEIMEVLVEWEVRDVPGAIACFQEFVAIREDRRADIEGEAF